MKRNEKNRNDNMYCCHYCNNDCVDIVDMRMDMVMEHSGMDESCFNFRERLTEKGEQTRMIKIDVTMPTRCAECPCYDDTMYGKCNVTGKWLDSKDGAWFNNKRADWCPLQEETQCDAKSAMPTTQK